MNRLGNSPFNYQQSQLQGSVLNPGGGPAQIALPPLVLKKCQFDPFKLKLTDYRLLLTLNA